MSTLAAQNPGRLPALWFGLVGAPAAWSVHLLVNYPLAAYACFRGSSSGGSASSGAFLIAAVVVSVVAFGVGVAGFLVALRQWRELPKNASGADTGSARAGRTRFMVLAGLLLSAVFVVGIVMNSSALLLASPCW